MLWKDGRTGTSICPCAKYRSCRASRPGTTTGWNTQTKGEYWQRWNVATGYEQVDAPICHFGSWFDTFLERDDQQLHRHFVTRPLFSAPAAASA